MSVAAGVPFVFLVLLMPAFGAEEVLSGPANITVFGIDEPLSVGVADYLGNETDSSPGTKDGLCVSEHNAERSKNGRPLLVFDPQLEKASKTHNDLMASKGQLSHQLPGEASLGSRVSQAGYKWRGVGENIAQGYRSCDEAVKAWMGSAGHRQNILGNYKHIGCAQAPSGRGSFWTCDFGAPA